MRITLLTQTLHALILPGIDNVAFSPRPYSQARAPFLDQFLAQRLICKVITS
jgi:hypothetical protein